MLTSEILAILAGSAILLAVIITFAVNKMNQTSKNCLNDGKGTRRRPTAGPGKTIQRGFR